MTSALVCGKYKKTLTLEQKFMRFVYPEPTSGCWLWVGTEDFNGYGKFTYKGARDSQAHRVSHELFNGPIPDGLVVRHKCDVRCCVNPNHLELGTQKENLHDAISRGRDNKPFGERVAWAKLSDEKVREIKQILASGSYESYVELAARYGVRTQAIARIRKGTGWKHVV
jgi:hypothetical protein